MYLDLCLGSVSATARLTLPCQEPRGVGLQLEGPLSHGKLLAERKDFPPFEGVILYIYICLCFYLFIYLFIYLCSIYVQGCCFCIYLAYIAATWWLPHTWFWGCGICKSDKAANRERSLQAICLAKKRDAGKETNYRVN